jgi:hypothetical protein
MGNEISRESPEEKAAWAESLSKIMVAREAIMNAVSKLPTGGTINPCPVCKLMTLHFTVASNGHVHAHCDSGSCVSWME